MHGALGSVRGCGQRRVQRGESGEWRNVGTVKAWGVREKRERIL